MCVGQINSYRIIRSRKRGPIETSVRAFSVFGGSTLLVRATLVQTNLKSTEIALDGIGELCEGLSADLNRFPWQDT